LTFVARRLDRDGIAMLFGVREPERRDFPATGIQELRLSGLNRVAAAQLLAERVRQVRSPWSSSKSSSSRKGTRSR